MGGYEYSELSKITHRLIFPSSYVLQNMQGKNNSNLKWIWLHKLDFSQEVPSSQWYLTSTNNQVQCMFYVILKEALFVLLCNLKHLLGCCFSTFLKNKSSRFWHAISTLNITSWSVEIFQQNAEAWVHLLTLHVLTRSTI